MIMAAGCALHLPAQEAWGVPTIISPEVNADRTVTFRLKAPGASEVRITGDFPDLQKAEMQKDSTGLWTYTTEPLDPDMYRYNYVVDGLTITDPASVYHLRDACWTMSYFIVPGEGAELYEVCDVPHGTISKVWYDSPTIGMKRRMSIYTPPGYENGDTRYPVLYLLHGLGGDEEVWLVQARAAQILDNLLAAGKIEPMIVVLPNGNPGMEAAPGETHFGLEPATAALPHTMDGLFEEAFPDIVTFVDNTYRTKADKAHRAIAGLSMGGYHSLHTSKQYPDLFDYIGLFSAAVDPRVEGSEVYKDPEAKLKRQFAKGLKLYWIAIGKDDFIYNENVGLRKMLDSLGLPYQYYESDGAHTWKNWRNYLSIFTPMLFK